jgi:hypothetical protein
MDLSVFIQASYQLDRKYLCTTMKRLREDDKPAAIQIHSMSA